MQQTILTLAAFTIGIALGFGLHGILTKPTPPCGRFYVELLDENDPELAQYLDRK